MKTNTEFTMKKAQRSATHTYTP